MLVIGH